MANRRVGRSNGLALLSGVVAVVVVVSLVCVHHSSACQSCMDNNVTTAASTEGEVTTAQTELTKTAIITSEQEDAEDRRNLEDRVSQPKYVYHQELLEDVEGRSLYQASGHHLRAGGEGGKGEELTDEKTYDVGGKEEVKTFIRRFIHAFDTGRLSARADWYFHPEASFHMLLPSTAPEGKETTWKEYGLKGRDDIKKAMKKHKGKSRTVCVPKNRDYEFVYQKRLCCCCR
eukprot:GHVS01029618.1.p1 GENE.GHVS01029618.1~~GHVS01029618.1.p1  ORF type:complete len:238 (+),score=44.79 GHVS01029618.1:24-716(+)